MRILKANKKELVDRMAAVAMRDGGTMHIRLDTVNNITPKRGYLQIKMGATRIDIVEDHREFQEAVEKAKIAAEAFKKEERDG